MKTLVYLSSVFAVLCVLNTSCKKDLHSDVDANTSSPLSLDMKSGKVTTIVDGFTGAVTSVTDKLYCSAKTVPICAGQTANAGTVSVQTGIDGKTYITYALNGLWKMKELHLYAGPLELLPVNSSGNPIPGQFPYVKTWAAPYTQQQFTFVLTNMPPQYIVAAHASIEKINNNGTVLDSQTGWGDGCNGKQIVTEGGGNWGTYFDYSSETCTLTSALTEEISTCSMDQDAVLGLDPVYQIEIPWQEPSVTVAGYIYSEAEAREIAKTPDTNKGAQDSKFAFKQVATLRASHTDIAASGTLIPAVATIETWLATQGKLSPANLPTGNNSVKNAAAIIQSWITTHICQGRR